MIALLQTLHLKHNKEWACSFNKNGRAHLIKNGRAQKFTTNNYS